jgi:hypothetical protein
MKDLVREIARPRVNSKIGKAVVTALAVDVTDLVTGRYLPDEGFGKRDVDIDRAITTYVTGEVWVILASATLKNPDRPHTKGIVIPTLGYTEIHYSAKITKIRNFNSVVTAL